MDNNIKKWFNCLLKYGAPFLLLTFTALMIYGAVSPWPIAEKELKRYDYDLKIQTGWTYKAGYQGGEHYEYNSRTFVLFKNSIIDAKSVTISVNEKGTVKVEESDGAMFTTVITFLFLMFSTYWFWIRKKT